jgi:hypothetical protein
MAAVVVRPCRMCAPSSRSLVRYLMPASRTPLTM